ncbi:FG-GAP repeat domain-containing protein [Engelhardtia mirabilis]|uniref:FG-GAP repeat protein n=1 Tax=Engelhardtia mirabilis TaxID=2528011 RepID=A0A518BGV4_9BACT|nr:FG-GAP repeat protein [Planctomycetes bacterium Pla133]QDV00532.1 FG-GAP repeat protein [Planctomycetes bacterium Pla86]
MKPTNTPLIAVAVFVFSASANAQSSAVSFALQATPDLSSSSPFDTASGDFDGDGRRDVAVACGGTDSGFGVVNVLLNDGYPNFDDKSLSTGGAPWGVCAADFDADGLDDLAVVNGGSSSSDVRIFLSQGGGTFAVGQTLPSGSFPLALKSADFDEDGDLDLAVACNVSGGLKIYLGGGDGTFSAPLSLAGTHLTDVAVGDVDGDGHMDVAFSHYDGAKVYRGNGDGTFASDYVLGTGQVTEAIALGDLNGDGKDDLVAVELYSSVMRVALSKPSGGLGLSAQYPLVGDLREVEIADLNADGLLDVAVVSESHDRISVLLGLGGGALATKIDFSTPLQPRALAVDDLSGDGRPELAVACRNFGETPPLACFTNQSGAPEWSLVGPALPGSAGAAVWTGTGSLQAGASVSFSLTGGAASAPALVVVGLSAANLPLFGGLLVPANDGLVTGLTLGASGALAIPWTWPTSLSASGSELYTQVWYIDLGAPQLVAASNGLLGRTL